MLLNICSLQHTVHWCMTGHWEWKRGFIHMFLSWHCVYFSLHTFSYFPKIPLFTYSFHQPLKDQMEVFGKSLQRIAVICSLKKFVEFISKLRLCKFVLLHSSENVPKNRWKYLQATSFFFLNVCTTWICHLDRWKGRRSTFSSSCQSFPCTLNIVIWQSNWFSFIILGIFDND